MSVHPIGERVVPWPPRGHRLRYMNFFVPVIIDDAQRMEPGEAFVQERFPGDEQMVAVLPVPGGAVGYHIGRYGERWDTNPSERENAIKGGFVVVEQGVGDGA